MSKKVDWAQLVREVQTETPGAFDELVRASDHRLEKVCYTILKQPQDVEDVKQETYEKIYLALTGQGRAPLRNPEKYPAWAEKIARYTAINYLDHKTRKTGRDETRGMTSTEDSAGIDLLENDPGAIELSPDQFSEEKLVHELISSALDTLSIDRRQCLALWQEGYKYQEISEKLNIPIGTVRSHIHYGRIQLKTLIKEIEEKYHVKIHGFALSFLGGEVIPHFSVESTGKNTGWIQASSKMKDTGSSSSAGSGKPAPKPGAALVRKIIAVVASVLVITGGIVFALHYARQSVNPDVSRRSTTAVVQSVSANRQSPGNNPTRPTRSVVQNQQQSNVAVAPAPQTEAPTQAPQTTTQTTTRVWQENSF